MKSKTKISKQANKKINQELVETIREAKKYQEWLEIAGILSGSRRKKHCANISEIESASKQGDIIVVPGKVLSQGTLTKKIKVVAEKFSEKAREKLKNAHCESSLIFEEIKKNPEAKGIKIFKK